MRLCFLASGNGGNFKFIHLISQLGIIEDITLFLIADRECGSLTYAQKKGIYNKIMAYDKKNNIELLDELEWIKPDLIVTNWHKILGRGVVRAYSGKLINLHYSLLPAFGGLIGVEPIRRAYDSNCQYMGVTCHYVDEGIDTGNIISQAIIKTNSNFDSVVDAVFRKGCVILLNSIMIVRDEYRQEGKRARYEYWDFSPNLYFDITVFDDEFWDVLANL